MPQTRVFDGLSFTFLTWGTGWVLKAMARLRKGLENGHLEPNESSLPGFNRNELYRRGLADDLSLSYEFL